jgi:N,N'-diacetylchitobiose transport system permease protein
VSVVAAPTDTPQRVRRPRRRSGVPYGLVLPAVGVLLLALGYPLVRQVVMSLQEYGLAQQFGQPAEWVGLANYQALLTDSYLWSVVLRSVLFCLANAAVTMVLGMAVAVLLTRLGRFLRVLTQAGLLLAWAMPVVAALTIWQWIFDPQYGIANWLLVRVGFDQFAGHSWLLDPLSFYLVATVVVVWMSVPFVVFTVYAALTQVSAETLEAAQLDGAGGWQRFRFVIVPSIRPVLLVVGLLQIIWDIRVFTQIYVLQKTGGISTETNLIGTYVYRLGIAEGKFGMASAVAIFMLVLTVLLTLGYVRRMLRTEPA